MTARSPFFDGSQLQYAWDSTSLGYLKTCPRKYYLTMIEGWRKKDESVHLTFGSHFHTALEHFDKFRATGMDYDLALEHTVKLLFALCQGWDPENSPKKNPDTLFRSVIWYLEAYKDDAAKTVMLANGVPAVELSFSFDSGVPSPHGDNYLLSGHMDRLVEYADEHFVMDRKTTGGAIGPYFFQQFNPHNQMSLYTLASQVVYNHPVKGVMIDAAKVNVGFTEFDRGITTRTQAQLDEWLVGFADWTRVAERYAEVESWPMNEESCGNYGGCVFRGICSKDPSVRHFFLETDFEKRFWNPLEVR